MRGNNILAGKMGFQKQPEKTVVKDCPVCNKEFKSYKYLNKIYCSNDCRYEDMRRDSELRKATLKNCSKGGKKAQYTLREKNRAKWESVICKQCGKEFDGLKNYKRLYCSHKCHYRSQRKPIIPKIPKFNPTRFKKGRPEIEGRIDALPRGINHWKWQNNPSYSAVHAWIRKVLGKPNKCSKCGFASANNRQFHWHNISNEYKRDVIDWQRLCATCHVNIHKNWEKRWG